jgi:competence protein ComEC
VPLIVAVALAHVAGLLTPGWRSAPLALAGCLLLAGWTRPTPVDYRRLGARLGVLAAIAAIGIGRRQVADSARAACLMARDAREAVVWLVADARARTTVGGVWTWRSCRLPISVQVAAGEARAGDAVSLAATRVPGGRGLRAIDATIAPTGARDLRLVARARVHAALDAAFGGGDAGAFARALVTGDATQISTETRDRWAASGLVHLISVSGLHVAIVIDAVAGVLRLLRRSRRQSEVASLVLIGGYIWLLGAPAPAVRAAITAAWMIAARVLDRPTDPWAVWAIACAVPLWDPTAPRDVGYQLSALGAAALVIAGIVNRRPGAPPSLAAPHRAHRSIRRATAALQRAVVVGVMASVVTLPVTLWVFGRVSLIAPVSNLIAAPLMTVVQPALFVVVLLAPWPALSAAVAWVARTALALADAVAELAARVPVATLSVRPSLVVVLLLAAGIGVGCWSMIGRGRHVRMGRRWGGVIAALLGWAELAPHASASCALHVIDVGQGDGLALRTGGGRWVVVDAGPAWRGGDAGRRAVLPYLARHGGHVALVILSHADLDHAGGAASVIAARRPALVWDPGVVAGIAHYRTLLASSAGAATQWHRARLGDRLRIDDLELEVVGPDSAWISPHTTTNDASLIVRATCRATAARPALRFLLTGDAGAAQEARLIATAGATLEAEVLKVPHHGSRTSSTDALLDAVHPALAVISVGAGNRYGHPSPDVLDRYAARGIAVLRTDRDGSIVIRAGPTGPEIGTP